MIRLPNARYKIGDITVNCHDMSVAVGERVENLPAKVFDFLLLLIQHHGKTVTKENAIDTIWLGNIDVGKRGAGNAIWLLRKTFAELTSNDIEYFKTINKVGYQLLVEPIVIDLLADQLDVNESALQQPKDRFTYIAVLLFSLLLVIMLLVLNHETDDTVNQPALTPERITHFQGVEEHLSISPDGQKLAFIWRRENKKSKIYIKHLGDSSAPLRQLTVSDAHESSPVWSPDSTKIAYMRNSDEGNCSIHIRTLSDDSDEQLIDGCVSIGYKRLLDWSPDGERLAYSKPTKNGVAIMVHHFETSQGTQYTFPEPGYEDVLPHWMNNSEGLVFVRNLELSASIIVKHDNGESHTIVSDEKMVIGLDVEMLSGDIYYNALRGADFVFYRYDEATKNTLELYNAKTPYSIAVHNRHLYYAHHIAQEHITLRAIESGELVSQVTSSSRDLYGKYVPSKDHIVFISNRSGSWEVWLKTQDDNKQLTFEQGQISIPAASPTEYKAVVAIHHTGEAHYVMTEINLANGQHQRLITMDGDVRNPSYSEDGKRLYFSANANGSWNIYRYDFASRSVTQITQQGGRYAIEAADGSLYFTIDNVDGLFHLKTPDAKPQLVTHALRAKDWGSFFIKSNYVYYVSRDKDFDYVKRLSPSGEILTLFKMPSVSIRNESGIARANSDSMIVNMLGINDADIYRLNLSLD